MKSSSLDQLIESVKSDESNKLCLLPLDPLPEIDDIAEEEKDAMDNELQEASWEDVSSGMSDTDEWQSYAIDNGAVIASERSRLRNFKNTGVQYMEKNELYVP